MAIRFSKISIQLAFLLSLSRCLFASSSDLREDLLEKYDKTEYPGDVTVIPEVTYRNCPTIDSENILSHNIKEHYEWNDKRLQWNPERYSGIRTIEIPLKSLWTPDIKLSESSRVDEVDGLASDSLDLTAKILWTGTVKVDRFSRYRTRCYVSPEASNILDCSVKFGSMKTYPGDTTFTMVRSECNTDLFGPMKDQCREMVVTRETDIETYSFNSDSPMTYWHVVKLRLHQKSRYFVDF